MKHSEIDLQIKNIRDTLLAIDKENLQGVKGGHFSVDYVNEKVGRIQDYLVTLLQELHS